MAVLSSPLKKAERAFTTEILVFLGCFTVFFLVKKNIKTTAIIIAVDMLAISV